jgi:hypothetical protein
MVLAKTVPLTEADPLVVLNVALDAGPIGVRGIPSGTVRARPSAVGLRGGRGGECEQRGHGQ